MLHMGRSNRSSHLHHLLVPAILLLHVLWISPGYASVEDKHAKVLLDYFVLIASFAIIELKNKLKVMLQRSMHDVL